MEIIVDLCNQHHGSLSELKRMALNAWSAGADVVKVQLMNSEKFFGNADKKYRDIDFKTFPIVLDSDFKIEEFASGLFVPVNMEFIGDDLLILENLLLKIPSSCLLL